MRAAQDLGVPDNPVDGPVACVVMQGARVRVQTSLAPTHAAAALASYPAAFGFLSARLAGRRMRANTRRYLAALADPAAAG